VIASGHGAPADVVEDGRTGLHFKPSDPDDLAAKVRQLMGDETLRQRMRAEVRREYLGKYSGESNFEMLMSVYHFARAERSSRDKSDTPAAPVSVARG
jgi:glycosyltransferase involved in cell wall biosynthesis